MNKVQVDRLRGHRHLGREAKGKDTERVKEEYGNVVSYAEVS